MNFELDINEMEKVVCVLPEVYFDNEKIFEIVTFKSFCKEIEGFESY